MHVGYSWASPPYPLSGDEELMMWFRLGKPLSPRSSATLRIAGQLVSARNRFDRCWQCAVCWASCTRRCGRPGVARTSRQGFRPKGRRTELRPRMGQNKSSGKSSVSSVLRCCGNKVFRNTALARKVTDAHLGHRRRDRSNRTLASRVSLHVEVAK